MSIIILKHKRICFIMRYEKEIRFKNISLKIETPTEDLLNKIFNTFGYKQFENKKVLQSNLVSAIQAYNKKEYYQYVIHINNNPVGFLKMEEIETKRGKPLNDGLRFNESRVFKMGLIIGDDYLKTEIISDIIFCMLNFYSFNKGVLFATKIEDDRFKKALENNLFKEIVNCKYDEIVKHSETTSDCKFYLFKSAQETFALNNQYVAQNRKIINNICNPLLR